ncbi:MAG: plasmid replication initiator RepA (plasmid) [Candidatus Symbiodolus clandestinus]
MSCCINALPQFVAPADHKPRPAFSQRCGRASQRCDIAHWLGFRVLPPIDPASLERFPQRQRCLNEHRARAMQAVMAAISHFFNISTGLVHCTVEKLAELCGLITVSKNGNRSITRASRCIQQMEHFGLLRCENEWNAALGVWYPKIIQVTPLFFEAINIAEKDWQAAIHQQQAYQRQGLAGPQEQLSQEEARERQITQLREIHLKAKLARQEIKRARKLQQLTLQQQRRQISQSIVKSLNQPKIVALGLPGIQKLVNQKLWEFRRLLSHSPPA